jgi:uncharacterized membrane protein YfhO
VRLLEDAPSRLRLRAEVPAGGAYLLVRDSYDPGWGAEVDGREAALVRADGLWRAVRLAEGTHEVVLAYRPAPLLLGALLSLATALGLLVAYVLARRRARAS